ncbi:MAG: hypothetical protein B1H04_03250, partial [Planctomycetales bacterium 4484_123]
ESFQDYFDELVVRCYCTEENFRRLDWAEGLARQLRLTIPQVALAWVFNQPMNVFVFALVGCRRPEEFKANVAAVELTLPAEPPAWARPVGARVMAVTAARLAV